MATYGPVLAQDNSVERAADWVFSHAGELDADTMDTDQEQQPPAYMDGPGSESHFCPTIK